MLEFCSITVSSTASADLADQMTQQSAAGWALVSIVSSGSEISAFMSRTVASATTAPVAAVVQPGSPVDEPAGWAVQPESAIVAAQASASPAVAAASSAGAAPAGWYSDPSTRFEMRYWDGAQWTEHVSRAGKQFTDAPVA